MSANTVALRTLELRLEAVREAVQRARFSFLVATIASLSILAAAWNAYLSWYRGFAMRPDAYAASGTSVVDEAQKQIVAEWVKNQTITAGILGIRVGISDAAVVGALGLFVASIWMYFSLRRANRTIGYLLQDVMDESYEIKNLVFHGIAARLVFSDIGRGDQPVRSLEDRPPAENVVFVRQIVKVLFFLPAATIFIVIALDLLSICCLNAPFRPGHKILLPYMKRLEWAQIGVWETFALVVGIATARLCLKGIRFENATETVLKAFLHHLGTIDSDVSTEEPRTAE